VLWDWSKIHTPVSEGSLLEKSSIRLDQIQPALNLAPGDSNACHPIDNRFSLPPPSFVLNTRLAHSIGYWHLLPKNFYSISICRLVGKSQAFDRSVAADQTLRQKCVSRATDNLSAAIVSSQSVKTTEIAQSVGYDGGKLGHKTRHIVDTLGLLLRLSLVPT